MANIKQCDRCKKSYHRNSMWFGGKAAGMAKIDTYGNIVKIYDLCDKCLKDLNDFLKKGKINDTGELEKSPPGSGHDSAADG